MQTRPTLVSQRRPLQEGGIGAFAMSAPGLVAANVDDKRGLLELF